MTHSFPTRRSSDLKVLAEVVAILRADLDPRILPVENLRTKAESASQEVACRHGLRFHDREAPETRLRVILRVGKQITAVRDFGQFRSEEHTSELQSLMRISYAVFCLKKKITKQRKSRLVIILYKDTT